MWPLQLVALSREPKARALGPAALLAIADRAWALATTQGIADEQELEDVQHSVMPARGAAAWSPLWALPYRGSHTDGTIHLAMKQLRDKLNHSATPSKRHLCHTVFLVYLPEANFMCSPVGMRDTGRQDVGGQTLQLAAGGLHLHSNQKQGDPTPSHANRPLRLSVPPVVPQKAQPYVLPHVPSSKQVPGQSRKVANTSFTHAHPVSNAGARRVPGASHPPTYHSKCLQHQRPCATATHTAMPEPPPQCCLAKSV
eukprot:1159924-Pelagomonas_calceolata.AAC.9